MVRFPGLSTIPRLVDPIVGVGRPEGETGHVGRVRGCLGDRGGRRAGAAQRPGNCSKPPPSCSGSPRRARWSGSMAQTTRLTAIGGDRWAGLRALPARDAGCGVPAHLRRAEARGGRAGLPAGTLPRSRTTPPDAPASGPAATARQLIAWARSRDRSRPRWSAAALRREDLATWDPIALAGLDAELADTARPAARVPGPLAGAARAGGPRHAVGGGVVPDAAQPVRDRVPAVRASGLREVSGRDRLAPVGPSRAATSVRTGRRCGPEDRSTFRWGAPGLPRPTPFATEARRAEPAG